jgi:hypothetical protein
LPRAPPSSAASRRSSAIRRSWTWTIGSDASFTRLLDANSLEDLPGKWQAAILDAEGNRPKLRLVSDD